jgi:hypothetical protein
MMHPYLTYALATANNDERMRQAARQRRAADAAPKPNQDRLLPRVRIWRPRFTLKAPRPSIS